MDGDREGFDEFLNNPAAKMRALEVGRNVWVHAHPIDAVTLETLSDEHLTEIVTGMIHNLNKAVRVCRRRGFAVGTAPHYIRLPEYEGARP